jgi:hypothetical protein
MAFDHLRLGLELVIDAVEHVPDQQGAVADNVLRGPDRVEVGEIGLRDEPQGLAAGSEGQARGCQGGCDGASGRNGGGLEESASVHVHVPHANE